MNTTLEPKLAPPGAGLPWFGPLDAAGWHVLSAGHMGIHRVQIERILAGMPRP